MLKLPLCPYCGAHFLYPTVKESIKYKTKSCPHCNNTYKINSKYKYFLFLAAILLLVGVNWLFLTIPSMNLLFLTGITALGVIAAYFLIPYTIRYQKTGPAAEHPKKSRK